ncbi:type II toxin-antitoxin system HipA family toxin [beta proteobacterium MWH-UniP1]
MNGLFVGTWSYERGGLHRFTYDHSWVQSPACRSLSLSLPITGTLEIRGDAVENYFDNLLPDNERIRKRLSARYQTKSARAFDLLEAIGRDCVGAVQLLPQGSEPTGFDRISYESLDEAAVAKHLRMVTASPAYGWIDDSDFRISIAGAQEKTALLKVGANWCLPKGSTPTSHIFKLPLGLVGGYQYDLRNSVENEWLCLKFLAAIGLPVATAEIGLFEDQKVLIVERFDRRWVSGQQGRSRWLARLPQEDFCQVLGISADRKYQSMGGPGIEASLKILQGSQGADLDRAIFVMAQFAFWLLAAIDGHGKNFSVRLHAQDKYELTPLYDVISAWPVIGHGANRLPLQNAKLAMGLKGKNIHYAISEIRTRHWKLLAKNSGLPGIWELMLKTAETIESAIASVMQQLPDHYPEPLAEAVFNGVRKQTAKFLKEADV